MDLTTYYDLQRYLDNGTYPVGYKEQQQKQIQQRAKHFKQINRILYKINRRKEPAQPLRVLKTNEIEAIMHNLHADSLSGHFGYEGTYQRIAVRYWWNGMGTDIKNFVKTCDTCQKTGGRTTQQPLYPIKVGQPFDRLVIDLVGPCKITTKQNKYIVVAINYFTKWPEARAIPDKKASTVATFIYEDVICRHGCPKELQSDNGTEFVNRIIQQLTEHYKIKHKFSAPYHPQTNGIVERFNRTLCTILQKYTIALKEDWDTHLPAALFAYRTLKNATTKHEPFFLTYGREARMPIELEYPTVKDEMPENTILSRVFEIINHRPKIMEQTQETILEQQLAYKERHDAKIRITPPFEIGEKVLIYDMAKHATLGDKFRPQWSKNWYYIHEKAGNNAYKLRNQKGEVLKAPFNGKQLKRYYDAQDLNNEDQPF